MCRTHVIVLRELRTAWEEGFRNGELQPGYCEGKFAKMLHAEVDYIESESDLRNFRDMTVLFLSRVEKNKDVAWDLMSALTSVIDYHLFDLGYEV